DREEEDHHGEGRLARARGRRRRPGGEGDQRDQDERESDPEAVGAALQDQRRHREPQHGREPDGQKLGGGGHSAGGGGGSGSHATAMNHASTGAITPPYHQSRDSPARRIAAT